MKTKILYLALLFIGLFSCQKETSPEFFSFGTEKSFHLNDEYLSGDNSLKFSISEINDSRCPSDVVCIWQGKADVKIEVENPIKETIVLNTFDNLKDTVGNYSFELKDVSPYPISTQTIKLEDYDVTLKILELDY